jgi:hypothetical protein
MSTARSLFPRWSLEEYDWGSNGRLRSRRFKPFNRFKPFKSLKLLARRILPIAKSSSPGKLIDNLLIQGVPLFFLGV